MKVRLKPDSLARVREWAAELHDRADEVLATLRDEGVVIESAFLDQTDDGDFLIYYMKSRDAVPRCGSSPHPIDAYHQQFKLDTWQSREQLELLIDFENLPSNTEPE